MDTQLFSLDETALSRDRSRRILFVDEDPSILDELQKMLHQMPAEWEPAFRTTAKDAFVELSGTDFDVIVSSSRLPDMRGFELLSEVLRRHPQVVRIIFSGGVKQDLSIRAANSAHQYLLKPCDAATLRSTLTTALRIREMLVSPNLKAVISRITSLPSLPAVHTKLIETLNNPEVSSRELGDIIAQDVALTSKILQIANSAYFGLYRYIASPAEAAVYLGVDTIRGLTLSAGVFSAFQHTGLTRIFIEQLQRHSMAVGTVAGALARAEGLPKKACDASVVGGFLHDVGKLVLASNYPKEYGDILAVAKNGGAKCYQAEQETFGATHAEIGGYLLWLWGFPDALCHIVAHHHQPTQACPSDFCAAGAVYVADALDHETEEAAALSSGQAETDDNYLVSLGLLGRLPEWRRIYERSTGRDEAIAT